MSDSDIRHETHDTGGRYVLARDGLEAELTYSNLSENLISADHTGVPPIWRGQGVAHNLVKALVEDAQQLGFRIVPRCSYVDVQRRRHPDWAEFFEI